MGKEKEPLLKKRSLSTERNPKKKGQPRADHKHEYETVLLYHFYEPNVLPDRNSCTVAPTKVCQICGRVGFVDMEQYDHVDMEDDLPYKIKKRIIRDEDKMEKWYVSGFFEKFAHKSEGDLPNGTIYHW